MRIVALDTFVTDFDGLSWQPYEELGTFVKYLRTEPAQILERSEDAEAIIVNKVEITRDLMEKLPNLRYIGVFATGVNCVDLKAAKEHSIIVTNVPAYSTDAVAQHVFAFLLHEFNSVAAYDHAVKAGKWVKSSDFCFIDFPLSELSGKNLAVIGYGNIGKKVCEIARAFSMNILVPEIPGRSYQGERPSLEAVIREADIVSFHCPLSESTLGIVNDKFISWMKKEAVLINTSRGGLINERDLAKALREGKIRRYYADVLALEPPTADNLLLNAPNCILTPHIAWASAETRNRLIKESAENLKAFINGESRNRV